MDHRDDYLWDPQAAPDPEVVQLEQALQSFAYRPRPLKDWVPARPRSRWRMRPIMILSAAAAVVVVLGTWLIGGSQRDPWAVTTVAGTPRLDEGAVRRGDRLGRGQWLVTDARSKARLAVGRIGTAELGPGSRLRLVQARGTEHRLELEQGIMHARIWAPPRFFLVETPAALAVDLGCVYSLRVDPSGSGVLMVTGGQVELVREGRRSLVPAGNAADMRPGHGPGTPYPIGSSPSFRAALASLDFRGYSDSALDTLLSVLPTDATISLWHLLARVPADARLRLFDRLAAISRPPEGVTREGIVRLDEQMLLSWERILEPTWSAEDVSIWKSTWRRLWSGLQRTGT